MVTVPTKITISLLQTVLTFCFLSLFISPVHAMTHPGLVINNTSIADIRAKDGIIPPVTDALNRMSQTAREGDPTEIWSQQMVEWAFTGTVRSNATLQNQAKQLLLQHSAGSLRYSFAIFNENTRKYIYGQPCSSLALSYDLLYPSLSDQERTQVRQLLQEWGSGLYSFYSQTPGSSYHNFHTSSVACLGLIGLALDGEVSQAPAWTTFAQQELQNSYLRTAFNPGGDYHEGHVYLQYGLPPAVMFFDALLQNKGIDLVQSSTISQLWNYYLYAYGANGSFPRYGDNTEEPFLAGTDLYLLQHARSASLKPEYLWVWQQLRGQAAQQRLYPTLFKDFDHIGMALYYPNFAARAPTTQAVPPSQVLQSQTEGTTQGATSNPGGMAVLRSDWNPANATSVWLLNRWRWQIHQHYDPNALELFAYGQTLISYFNNRSYDDPLRGKWSQQNTIRINPTSYDGDAPISNFTTGSSASLGSFPVFFQSSLGDVITSDSRYSHANLHRQGLPNGNFSLATPQNVTPIDRADRTILLARGLLSKPFYVLFDDFAKTNTQEYWWQVYIPNSANQISGTGRLDSPFAYTVDNAKMSIGFLNVPAAQITQGGQEAGRDDHAIRLAITQPQLKLLMVLFPLQATDGSPSFRQIHSNPDVYEITQGGESVQVLFNPSRTSVVYEDVETDAQLAVGKNWNVPTRKILFHQATFARFGGTDLFRTTQPSEQAIGGSSNSCSNPVDINQDGHINLADFSILASQFMQTGTLSGDVNCDQVVDIRDFTLFASQLNI